MSDRTTTTETTETTDGATSTPSPQPRSRRYADVVAALLLGAFTLSVVHTGYAWVAGLEDPEFTVTTPAAWAFYAVGFGACVLVRRDRRWVCWAVTAYLVVLLAISVLYYPTTFVPPHQTPFGWVENDGYVGLLVTALVLMVLRLRGVTLVVRR